MINWPENNELEVNHQSFVFYESFYLAMKDLSNEEAKKAEQILASCLFWGSLFVWIGRVC